MTDQISSEFGFAAASPPRTSIGVVLPGENAFDDRFLGLFLLSWSVVFGLWGLVQLATFSRKKRYGRILSPKSTGLTHLVRLFFVGLYAGLQFVLALEARRPNPGFSAALFVNSAVVALIILPLQVIEVHKSIWQCASALLYWLFTPLVLLAYVYQNNFTAHPLVDTSFYKVVDYSVFIVGILGLIFEVLLWKRAHEYTTHLALNNVDVNMFYNANVLGRISYTNLSDLINKAYAGKPIGLEDLPALPHDLEPEKCFKKMNKWWNIEKTKPNPTLGMPLARAFGGAVFVFLVLEMLHILTSFIQPQLLKVFMTLFLHTETAAGSPPYLEGIMICVAMTVTAFVGIILWNEYVNQTYKASLQVRISMTMLIYEKALKLLAKARKNRNVGDVVNMISVDASKVEFLIITFPTFVSLPVQFVLCIASLYFLLGWSSFSGLLVMAVAIPINGYAIKYIEQYYDQSMKFRDMRTKAISELINLIKSIKLYSWEKPMIRKIATIRNDKELETMKKIGILDCIIGFSWSCVPFFVSCITFASFTYFLDTKLTSDLIFPSLALFELLGDPLIHFPDVISGYIETKVSLNRLVKFLCDDELDENLITQYETLSQKGQAAAVIENATFYRSKDNQEGTKEDPALTNINFTAKKGELTCIVGNVGLGKTTFLQALLGHCPIVAANPDGPKPLVEIRGSVAYCPQNPWIMNTSIKKNILFGHRYDEEFFQKTVEACDLVLDFDILPDGVETQVGEKGISLSGGQKARISLARAVYARADIYLLDDVLSAVDAHVSKHIVDNVLGKLGILALKTLILLTNHLKVLREASQIYVLDHGKIDEQGSYDTLVAAQGEFSKLLAEFSKGNDEAEAETKAETEVEIKTETGSNKAVEFDGEEEAIEHADSNALDRVISRTTLRRASVATFHPQLPGEDNEEKVGSKSGQTAEISKLGRVSSSTYVRYAQAAGYWAVGATLFAVLMVGVTEFGEKLWLKHWADVNDQANSSTLSTHLISIYTLIGVLSGISVLFSGLCLWFFVSINASRNIHADLVMSVIKLPMSFFETTPTGRILNRFLEDIDKMDERFPRAINSFADTIVRTVYTLLLIAVTLPSTIIFIALLSLIYYYVQNFYMCTLRETKRLASTTRSPVYSHVHETLVGVDTIRAYGKVDRFRQINAVNMNHSATASMAQVWATRWLNFRLKLILTLFLFIVTMLCVYSLGTLKALSAGVVGLLTSFLFQITDTLNWLVRMSVDVETNAVAVERILEYCDLPSEKPHEIEKTRPPLLWPMYGGIKFDNYTTKYKADADPVLKKVSFEVKPQEKIGIVGRTGAGKSTLTLALFRIIEATEGRIIIDGVDTSAIGLYDLRSRLNIIPQDSQAFDGTVRQNLDPFHKYKDEDLWKALEMAHLKTHVESMKDEAKKEDENKDEEDEEDKDQAVTNSAFGDEEIPEGAVKGAGLYATVSGGGSNLSAGQKQLLCLARALLNPLKILLMDEATAAVDVKTDKIVQETIRSEFKDRTILTIAHRIDTILDNDKILVLDKGEVKEFDLPAKLLEDKSSIFYSLCEKGGYLKKDKHGDP